MTFHRRFATALVLVIAPTSGEMRAQSRVASEPSAYVDAQRGLSVEDIVALALKQSKRLDASREITAAAREDRTQAAFQPNPSLSVLEREQAAGPDRQTAIDLSWPLALFRRTARVDVGDRSIAVAEAQLASQEWDLAARVRKEAAQALIAIRLLELTRDQAAAARSLRDLIAASVDAGALPRLDRDVAQVDLQRIEASIPIRRADVEASLARLKSLAGMDPGAPLVFSRALAGEADSVIAQTTLRRAAASAADARPDVRVLTSQVALGGAQTLFSHQEGRWDVELMGGYMRTAMSFPQIAFGPGGQLQPVEGRFHDISFGARVTLPWRNSNRGAVAASAARERAVMAEREAALLDARAETRAAEARWLAAGEAVEVYAGGLLTLAHQNLEITQQTYLAGRATLNEVIAERRRVLELETTYTMLLGDRYVADIELRRALGVIR